MKRKTEVSELIFRIVAYVFLIVFALMCVYPLIYALAASFSSTDAIESSKVVLWPLIGEEGSLKLGFSLDAFKYVAVTKGNEFWIAYANTLFVCGMGTIWCMVYTILGAYALSKKRLLGRRGFNFFLVFTMWFSAGVVPQFLNYEQTGHFFAQLVGKSSRYDIDLKWLVVIAMGMNASNLILLRNAFEGVPSEIEEAARIDGATELQVLTQVFIPMSKATIATVALFFGISRWNGYFWSFRVMGTRQRYSWPVQVFIRDTIESYTNLTGTAATGKWSESFSALSVVYAMVVCGVIPILIIYPFIQKYFAKGVNMGGVKE